MLYVLSIGFDTQVLSIDYRRTDGVTACKCVTTYGIRMRFALFFFLSVVASTHLSVLFRDLLPSDCKQSVRSSLECYGIIRIEHL